MSPRNKEKNEQQRTESLKKITHAAFRVFAEYGYHGATMKKITNATGLSYGLVYHYFPSKEKIFLHLVDAALENSRKMLDSVLAGPGTAWEKICTISEHMVRELQSEELSLHFLIVLQAMTQGKDIPGIMDFFRERTEHYERFDNLIAKAQEDGDVVPGDPAILSAAYLSLVQGMALVMLQDTATSSVRHKLTPDYFNNLLQSKQKK